MMQSLGWLLRNWLRRWTARPRVGGEMKRLFLVLLILAMAQTVSAQDWAKEKLAKSPRHSEWVSVKHDGRSVETFVVYPESKDKRPVVLIIHEIFGM
jgi:carboxymethylenebutenolidase